MEYLTTEDLLALAADLGVGPVQYLGLLDSAAHRPSASVFGRDAYSGIDAKAGALLVRNSGWPSSQRRSDLRLRLSLTAGAGLTASSASSLPSGSSCAPGPRSIVSPAIEPKLTQQRWS
ncbi:hypothetical protein [uncultured Ornithinimicrobium sp.]|uniref:hypothetical protein n=1 Tax=uncultured Ornithinimicrobium sp. TaxID=259307 RepID=UPI002592654A|nr:hypothetical protein [uncultured Ornithinimicrobium sp.]